MVVIRRYLLQLLVIVAFVYFLTVNRIGTGGGARRNSSAIVEASTTHWAQSSGPVRPTSLDWSSVRQMEIDYWRTINVDTMTAQQIIDYFHWSNRSSCGLIHDFGGFMRINSSGIDGQKAVCLDPEVRPEPEKCLVYSFGIGSDWSFDETMEQYGCEIFSFDPTIGADSHFHSKSNRFYDIGLGGRDRIADLNWTIRTLSSIYSILTPIHGNKIIDYLKMDVEGYEWEALPQILSSGMLNKIRQMTVEFHLPSNSSLITHYRQLVATIKSIENAGMIRFDSKYNPWVIDKVPTLDNYYGSLAFEIAFYHVLPY